jgi:peptidoglycan/xylan/chitin deacetylase (PgdA/CDA1 family)
MWWDTLRDPAGTLLGPAERQRALEEGRGLDEAVRSLAAGSGWQTVLASDDVGLASLDELRASFSVGGVTIASHTWSHPNLTRLSDPELQEELTRSADWLRAEAGAAWRPWLAYPYGLTDTRVAGAARKAGYSAAFRVAGGWTRRPPEDPFDTPRLNVPAGLTPSGIRLRGAGLFC